MAWPRHYLIQFRGTFGTTTAPYEQWTTGIRLTRHVPLAPDWDMDDAILADIAGDFSTLFQTASIHQWCHFREARAYDVGPDGKATGIWYWDAPTPVAGQAPSAQFPPQVALVATLDTGALRPPARFGRMFLPGVSFGLPADGLIATSQAQQVADAVATFVNNVNNLPGGDPAIPLVSVVSDKPLEGTIRPVTSVRVGRVFDTIRSRRRQIPEAHVAAAVAIA